MHGIEFCIAVPSAYTQLNRMQANWAKALLGIHETPHGQWPILIAECGWPLRLGSQMQIRSIMLKARIQLLPTSHPAHAQLLAAACSEISSWARDVKLLQQDDTLATQVPDIIDLLSTDQIEAARENKETRRKELYRYRRHHVVPPFQHADHVAFCSSVENSGWPYASFQQSMAEFPDALLDSDWGHETWDLYRAWAVTRALGRLPLQVFGLIGLPTSLSICPMCSHLHADVEHILTVCSGTQLLYLEWAEVSGQCQPLLPRLPWPALRMELFADRISFLELRPASGCARVRFVGHAMKALANATLTHT